MFVTSEMTNMFGNWCRESHMTWRFSNRIARGTEFAIKIMLFSKDREPSFTLCSLAHSYKSLYSPPLATVYKTIRAPGRRAVPRREGTNMRKGRPWAQRGWLDVLESRRHVWRPVRPTTPYAVLRNLGVAPETHGQHTLCVVSKNTSCRNLRPPCYSSRPHIS